jgi:uncharacterized protein YecT (DUF1311 family)
MRKNLIAALLVFAWASTLCCQTRDTEAQIKAKCEKYLQTPLPAEANTIPTPAKFPTCHSLWLYYGFGGEKLNLEAARKCAWQERALFLKDKDEHLGSPADGGTETLANIYANGTGVQRSIPLALRFACESAELVPDIGQVEQLESLLNSPPPIEKKDYFNMCEGDPTTPAVATCASWDEVVKDEERQKAIQSYSVTWSASQQTALTALVKAEETYASAHGRGEINLAGTMRVIFEIDAESGLRDDFFASLKSFEEGHLPQGSANDLAQADTKLNHIYRRVIAEAESRKLEYGAVQPEGIRETERAWLKYRDAWVASAKLRYPSVNADAWLTLLTNDRIAILKDTACEIGIDDPSCVGHGEEHTTRPLP